MNKKEFIFPIVLLVLVVAVTLALVINHGPRSTSLGEGVGSDVDSSSIGSTTQSKPTASGASYYPYGNVVLSVNQVAGFKDGLSIRPVAVLEDNRCPVGVQCIQAGTVKVSVKANENGIRTTNTLALNTPITLGGDTVTLTQVTPGRSQERPPYAAEYRLTFTVVRTATTVSSASPCYVGGCSAQLCTDKPGGVSTCIYNAQYACYKTATCKRQSTGACGWTQTPELASCLANPPAAS